MQRYIISVFVLFIFALTSQAADLRSWTGSNGKVIEAEFVSYDKDNEIVAIKRPDGKELRVKLSLFSDKDQEFVKSGGKENTENPFSDTKDSVQEPLRIILNISEFGDCKYRIEKTKEPYKDDFVGEPITIPTNPNATVLKAKDGTLKWIHEFSNPIPTPSRFRNSIFNDETKILTLLKNGFINLDNSFSFPITIIFELLEYEGSEYNFRILGFGDDRKTTLQLKLHFKSQSPLLTAEWGVWEGKSTPTILKTLHESAPYPLQDTLEGEFRMPVPNVKNTKNVFLTISAVTDKISFSQIITKSRVFPIYSVVFGINDSLIYVTVSSKEFYGYKVGIREGDVLKSIDNQKAESVEQTRELLNGLTFGTPHTIVVERAGKTIPISY